MRRIATALPLLLSLMIIDHAAAEPQQTPVTPSQSRKQNYPKIVLYSVSWCPHCKEAKEYFTSRSIPFINKDVEADETFMEELSTRYKSQSVPVIVIGDDKVVLRGFSPERFEKAVEDSRKDKK
ncbi:glutaredoxin domain-containing protein [Geobacter sp. DSM 9736]|uniref:glutaredoxin domain-containing protein n=1 Tax=Geobacter sp. DSM 9736 TaxID=1277350 RepID=UPI000B50C684|nr:glutaredoxin domain-containing protein [Geobacter sp. DSM 9736]SNB46585.1 Glutaredoxin-like protein, YruB-family [Geobacter sp. DSM 9736]